jgi:hypothetical protein
MKICMYHNAKGLPELVLREELLAIVAAMITRLGKKEFEKHVIFPVRPRPAFQLLICGFD